MSVNYAFGISLFLLLLVLINLYFFYSITDTRSNYTFNIPHLRNEAVPKVFREIYEHLNYLPQRYKLRDAKFLTQQKQIINYFNSSLYPDNNIWDVVDSWSSEEALFPFRNGVAGQIIDAMRRSAIVYVDNAPKGTQLKFLLVLENKNKIFFKPKRYNHDNIIEGNIYGGFDRHNSEVLAYYLAMTMNFTWISPVVTRQLNVQKEIIPVATVGLKRTMSKKTGTGSVCIYGKCFYCKRNETVCEDEHGILEGAAVLYLDRSFRVYKSPWRRSYSAKKMDWEIDDDFCKKIGSSISRKRILDLADTAIFDFLIQNGDRHRYEVYKDKIVLLDNGKGLGNPNVDELDILAPLYQCCLLRASTWHHLETLTGGVLTETVKLAASLHSEHLTTDAHYKAIERRLLKVIATVHYCFTTRGRLKVIQFDEEYLHE